MEIMVVFKDELCYKFIKIMFIGICDKKLFVYIIFDIVMYYVCLFFILRGFNFER